MRILAIATTTLAPALYSNNMVMPAHHVRHCSDVIRLYGFFHVKHKLFLAVAIFTQITQNLYISQLLITLPKKGVKCTPAYTCVHARTCAHMEVNMHIHTTYTCTHVQMSTYTL